MIFRKDGTARIKLIAPGQGSSGYYPAETLRRDGPNVFKQGMHLFLNHQTDAEQAARPEGSIHDLAAVMESDAAYHDAGPEGPGLYSDIKGFKAYIPMLEELGPHIGLSIRASGKIAERDIDGKKTKVVEQLTYGKSCDFVTRAGAGGKFVSLLEAARAQVTAAATTTDLHEAAQAANTKEAVTMQDAPVTDGLIATEKALRESEAKAAKLTADLAIRDGIDAIKEQLKHERMPQVSKDKILTRQLLELPCNEDGTVNKVALKENLRAAIVSELEYIMQLQGSPVRGMNGATGVKEAAATAADVLASMERSYMSLGMTEEQAKVAAKGVN